LPQEVVKMEAEESYEVWSNNPNQRDESEWVARKAGLARALQDFWSAGGTLEEISEALEDSLEEVGVPGPVAVIITK
jgi:hypothetical protein